MGSIGIISTGDADKDFRILKQAQLFNDRLDQGLCPNGCALLDWKTAHTADCPECRFHYSTNLPHGKREIDLIM